MEEESKVLKKLNEIVKKYNNLDDKYNKLIEDKKARTKPIKELCHL